MSTTMTRAELLTACEEAFDKATGSKATKADLQRLLDGIESSGEERDTPAITRLDFLDQARQITSFNLADKTLYSRAHNQTFTDGVVVEGTGPVLTVDLGTMVLYADIAIEFDPPPSQRPIPLTFSDPNAAPPEEEPEEGPATEESQEGGSENGAILPEAEEPQVDPNEASVT